MFFIYHSFIKLWILNKKPLYNPAPSSSFGVYVNVILIWFYHHHHMCHTYIYSYDNDVCMFLSLLPTSFYDDDDCHIFCCCLFSGFCNHWVNTIYFFLFFWVVKADHCVEQYGCVWKTFVCNNNHYCFEIFFVVFPDS